MKGSYVSMRPESQLELLEEQEAIIERGLSSFIEVGNALMAIRDGELYREAGFDGFVEYLESKTQWGLTPQSAYYQIDAAKVSTMVEVANERQARELAPLMRKATPEVVKQTYDEVVEETGGKPTAKAIREKVQEVISQNGGTPKKKRSKVDADLEHHLSEIKKLIPRWESRFVDAHSGKEARRRVKVAEDIAEWLTEEYVPAHAALVTPLAKVPT